MDIRHKKLLMFMSNEDELKCLFFAHKGHSMDPVLLDGDLLEVLPYKDKPVKRGDVIVFHSLNNNTIIAHRAISDKPSGIYTRGDNNIFDDPWCLHHSAIIGKVISSTNYLKRRKVHGGFRGLVLARWRQCRHKSGRKCISFIYPIYRLVSSQKLLYRLGVHFIKPRVVNFRTNDDSKIILLSGERVIGQYNTCTGRWHISYFYRMFIDRSALPNLDNEQIR